MVKYNRKYQRQTNLESSPVINRDELMRTMYLSVSLLHEAYNRLEKLCEILPEPSYKEECSEAARQIHAHASTLREQVSLLLKEQEASGN